MRSLSPSAVSDHPGISEGQVGGLGDARSLLAEAGHKRGAWCRRGVRKRCQIISSCPIISKSYPIIISSSRMPEALLCTLLWQKSSYIEQWERLSSCYF